MVFRSQYGLLKRAIDILGAGAALVLLSPVLLVIAALVWLTSSGPAFYWSERVGRFGQSFRMPKFRTMTTCSRVVTREAAQDGDVCITPVGAFLRRTSLDELPQLLSVLRGDMSLVGPRPLLLCDATNTLRQSYPEVRGVRPGITGLAQISGRNMVSPRNKVRYDAFYAQRLCLFLDMRIAARTVGAVVGGRDIL